MILCLKEAVGYLMGTVNNNCYSFGCSVNYVTNFLPLRLSEIHARNLVLCQTCILPFAVKQNKTVMLFLY